MRLNQSIARSPIRPTRLAIRSIDFLSPFTIAFDCQCAACR